MAASEPSLPTSTTNGNDCVIIREVYESPTPQEDFEAELEQALESAAETIVIEPVKLGDETSRWIRVGNCLHKTAVLSSLSCLIVGGMYPDCASLYVPLGCTGTVCAGVYAMSWQFDPCCKYQVEYDARKLQRLPIHNLTSTTPVILVRKDDSKRKLLHNTLSLLAGTYCAFRIYRRFLN